MASGLAAPELVPGLEAECCGCLFLGAGRGPGDESERSWGAVGSEAWPPPHPDPSPSALRLFNATGLSALQTGQGSS